MNEIERECDFKIVGFVDGKKNIVECKECYLCPRELVWGIGVVNAFVMATGRTSADGIEACVDGHCGRLTSLVSTSEVI